VIKRNKAGPLAVPSSLPAMPATTDADAYETFQNLPTPTHAAVAAWREWRTIHALQPKHSIMSNSLWLSSEGLQGVYLPLLFAHVRTQKIAAEILDTTPPTLRKFCRMRHIYFTKPLNQREDILAPPKWFPEMTQFLCCVQRTEKEISLPPELVLHWAQEYCPNILRPEFLHSRPPPEPPRPPPPDWPPQPPPQFPPQPPRV
jgi:hypothetical protein